MVRQASVSRRCSFLIVAVAVAAGCSSTKVLIPPRVDLARYGTIGMIEFTSMDDPHLAGEVSREFLAAIQEAQPGTPVLELGKQAGILHSIRSDDLDPPTIRAIGEKYKVDAIVVGMLGAQEVKPKLAVGGLDAISASAEMEGLLDARIFDTKSGATIWTRAARAKEQVARVDLSIEGIAGVGANSPGESKNRLVQSLVERATVDFWPHWEKQ